MNIYVYARALRPGDVICVPYLRHHEFWIVIGVDDVSRAIRLTVFAPRLQKHMIKTFTVPQTRPYHLFQRCS